MHDLVDAAVMDARRFSDLSLCFPLLDRVADQAIPFGLLGFNAAFLVPYLSKAG